MKYLLAALALIASAVPAFPQASPIQADNAIVVVFDDVGWEDLIAVPTPTLDAVGIFGRTYPNAYASCVCSPSRYQLVFGQYQHREFIGSALVSQGSAPESVGASVQTTSIAAPLRAQGIRTAAFGKWHINNFLEGHPREMPRRHGFESWRAGIFGNITGSNDHYFWPRVDDGSQAIETEYTTHAIEGALEDWWTSTPGRKFAYVGFAAAHDPHQAAPPDLLPPGFQVGPTDRAKYESAVIGLDSALAELGGYVDLATTAIFVVCDNGTAQDVPPPGALYKGYKLSQYQGGVNVPFFAIGAGIAPGCDDGLVQVVDIPRTVLDVLGVPAPAGFGDSISFAATLDGQGTSSRPWAFVQRFAPSGGVPGPLTRDDWALVWADGWKVLVTGNTFGFPQPQAYDLLADPVEAFNLSGTPEGTTKIAEAWALRDSILAPTWPY